VTAQRRIRDLETERNRKHRPLLDAQDEIDRRKDRLISDVEARLRQQVETEPLFTIRWRVEGRGPPPGLPFRWDAETIRRGLNFTLTTALGDLDLLGEIVGGGGYADLLPHCQSVTLSGVEYRCLGLERLIHVKRAARRPRDLEAIAELEALREQGGDPDAG
jgi:hypothetical protein